MEKLKVSSNLLVPFLLALTFLLVIALYAIKINQVRLPNSSIPKMCTLEALECPDGSYVGRTGPNCEFTECPTGSITPIETTPTCLPRPACLDEVPRCLIPETEDMCPPASAEGKFCGGIAGFPCPNGYTCVLDGNYPDAGGKCSKQLQ